MEPGVMRLGDSLVAGGPSLNEGDGMLLFLTLTSDGKLRVHDLSGNVLWSPPVGDAKLTSATLTQDGNFAAYTGVFDDRKEVWSTGTAGKGVTEMQLSGGRLALIDTNRMRVVWTSTQHDSAEEANRAQDGSQPVPDRLTLSRHPALDLSALGANGAEIFVDLRGDLASAATSGAEVVRIVRISPQPDTGAVVEFADGSTRTYESTDELTICRITGEDN
ncbi:hypothetical protein [Actinomadura atramentaria]|uniref:hypothetical protein n=1 Tax=Actinomadura atramentaria TaxID=1990 RepID=UPI00035C67C4|nr:hypothetical protein [Actinomadura atramentaria]